MLNWLWGFVKSLFSRSRRDLEKFLKDNLPTIKRIILEHADVVVEGAYHANKDAIRAAIKARFPVIPDNWIEGAMFWAFEHFKEQIRKGLEPSAE
jgi:hypothetical protein